MAHPDQGFFAALVLGLALIFGLFTGIVAFFGDFINASFISAGTAGANPLMFILATWIVLAGRSRRVLGARPPGAAAATSVTPGKPEPPMPDEMPDEARTTGGG